MAMWQIITFISLNDCAGKQDPNRPHGTEGGTIDEEEEGEPRESQLNIETVTEDWFPDSPIVIRINQYSSLRSFRFTSQSPHPARGEGGDNIEYWECFEYLQRTKANFRLIWMRNKIVSIHHSHSMDGNGMWNCESPALLGDRKELEILSTPI